MSKAATAIQLKRQASELRMQAKAKLTDLEDFVTRQMAGELKEDETRLSSTEIAERNSEIKSLMEEAKALEDLDSTSGLMRRVDDASPEAKEIINEGVDPEILEGKEGGSEFGSLGNFLRAVRTLSGKYDRPLTLTEKQGKEMALLQEAATRYTRDGDKVDLKELGDLHLKTLTGITGTGGGEALVPTVHMSELLRVMAESQQFVNRARQIPMLRRSIDFPRLIQTDATDTRPLFGFAAITKIAEGAEKPEREPAFEQFTLTAVKYAAYLEAGDELLAESIINTQPLLVSLLTDAIAYEYDRDGMRGSGTGEPQGFIGSACEWTQNRIAANDVQLGDVFAMESRFFGGDGIYLYHPSVIPDLYGLSASNIIVWNPNLATGVPGTLLGRGLVRSHKLPALGTKGDFCLVDPMFYLAGNLQSITVANSIHYKFRNDVTAWRALFRAAGSPWPAGLFSTEASGGQMTYRVSPFVVLDVPASS